MEKTNYLVQRKFIVTECCFVQASDEKEALDIATQLDDREWEEDPFQDDIDYEYIVENYDE